MNAAARLDAWKPDEAAYALRGDPGSTLGEMVRQTLIALIMRGEFPEHHRLYPDQIAEKMGVSVTPVRQALLQLASEGFIENIQRRGFHIRKPTATQVRDMWQVRQSLELTAGELVIARLQSGELKSFDLDVLAQLQHAQQGDPDRLDHSAKLELNAQLHSTVVSLSGNTLLRKLHEGLRQRVLGTLVQFGTDSWRSRVEAEGNEHWAIINALRERDIDAYQAAVRAHLTRSLADALADVGERRP